MSGPAARASEIAPGTMRKVVVDDEAILICNVNGSFYAIEDVCTHDGGNLDLGTLEGDQIECPRHGARFDVRTGAVVMLPAIEPVRSYRVRVEGDEIFVETG